MVCLDALRDTLPTATGLVSSHGVGLAETIELARHLDRLPASLLVFAVESVAFEQFAPLSDAVEAAIPHVVTRILEVCAFVSMTLDSGRRRAVPQRCLQTRGGDPTNATCPCGRGRGQLDDGHDQRQDLQCDDGGPLP